VWHISFYWPDPWDDVFQLDYAPQKSGMILGATISNGNPLKAWNRMYVDIQQLPNGFWAPKTVRWTNLLDKYTDMFTYSEIKVNHSVDKSVFTVVFPAGATVDDRIKGRRYTVGGTP